MKTYTQEELNKILELHKKWLNGEDANLSNADLSNADLSNADLSNADLYNANLRYADLRYADLYNASLRYADLRYADLSNASLRYASLSNADLSYANLRYAKEKPFLPMACPDVGSFIGWKKAIAETVVIVKLEIQADAKRSSATGRKCRCDKAKVLEIQHLDETEKCDITEAYAQYDSNFKYTVGETVSVDDFEDDRYIECAPGIHFFINREEAVRY